MKWGIGIMDKFIEQDLEILLSEPSKKYKIFVGVIVGIMSLFLFFIGAGIDNSK